MKKRGGNLLVALIITVLAILTILFFGFKEDLRIDDSAIAHLAFEKPRIIVLEGAKIYNTAGADEFVWVVDSEFAASEIGNSEDRVQVERMDFLVDSQSVQLYGAWVEKDDIVYNQDSVVLISTTSVVVVLASIASVLIGLYLLKIVPFDRLFHTVD